MASLTPEREQKLIELACELVARVREIDPERNGMWLESVRDDWRDMLIVLAAMGKLPGRTVEDPRVDIHVGAGL